MDTRKIMHFLKGIAANNNRQWFQENKTEFEAVKANFEEGVDKVIACLSTFDDEVSHLTASGRILYSSAAGKLPRCGGLLLASNEYPYVVSQ